MKIDVDSLGPIRRRIRVELPAEAVAEEFLRVYDNLGRRAKVRGFRPGKVPRAILQGLYGEEVKGQVLSRLIEYSLSEAMKTQRLPIVSRPQVDANDLEEGKAFVFSAVVEVKPDLQVNNYVGLEVEKIKLSVDDEQVETALYHLQEQHAQSEPVEERDIVEQGDLIVLDFAGSLNGKSFQGGRQEGYLLEVGKGKTLPEFEQALVGLKRGQEHTISVPYPDHYLNQELAGKTVLFSVTVQSIKKKVLPPLDDEFAKDHGETSSLDELKQKIRTRLETEIQQIQLTDLKEKLLDRLVEANTFEIPPAMVGRQLQYLIERHRPAQDLPSSGEGVPEQLRRDLEPQARRQVQATLLIDKIAEIENITVSDEEVNSRIQRIARAAGERAAAVRQIYGKDNARDDLRSQMVYEKTVEFLLARANIKEVDPRVDAQGKKR